MNIQENNKQMHKPDELQKQKMQDARVKYFIQAIDVKQDMGMTRIYSALQQIKTK